MPNKIDRNLYRYAAEALRAYPYDRERLGVLNEYLSAAIGPEPGAGVREGYSLARQEAVLERKYRSAEWKRITFRVEVLDRLFGLLSNTDMRLVEMRFFRRLPWQEVADALSLTVVACRTRRGPKIVERAARIFFGDLC
jgi:hypothetical protein